MTVEESAPIGMGNSNAAMAGRLRALRSPGFTLIEVLVTLAIFTAVMAVLVEGLHSGIRTWRSIRLHQVRQAGLKVMSAKMAEDFRHLALIENITAISETPLQAGGEKIVVTTSVARKRQRAGLGWVWNEVEYAAATDADGAMCLKRVVQPRAGTAPVGSKPLEETVLEKVKSVQFDYLGSDGVVPSWTSPDSLPLAVLIRVQPESGRELAFSASVPGGWLKRSDIGG